MLTGSCRKPKTAIVVEATVKPLFKELIHLYEMALMIDERVETSRSWITPALAYLASESSGDVELRTPLSREKMEGLLGWYY